MGYPDLWLDEGERIAFAIAHLSDDKTVAKMGHPEYGLGSGMGGAE